MDRPPHTVTVVLDRDYGERLSDLPTGQPVWIVDTPPNRCAAEKLWAQHPSESHLTGVTTFKVSEDQSAEEWLIGVFDTIDLHHGSYSSDTPYTVINVIGAQLVELVKATLCEFGFNEFKPTVAGFRAIRPVPHDANE